MTDELYTSGAHPHNIGQRLFSIAHLMIKYVSEAHLQYHIHQSPISNRLAHISQNFHTHLTAVTATGNTTTSEFDRNRELPWYAAYPAPRQATPPWTSRAEVLQLFRDGKQAGRDFILIDLRKTDHEVGSHAREIVHCRD